MSEPAASAGRAVAIFADGWFETDNGKAGHALLRYGPRRSCACRLGAGGPAAPRSCPTARATCRSSPRSPRRPRSAPNVLAIGVAPTGGKLPPEWRAGAARGARAGLNVEAGLHDELGADPELRDGGRARGRRAARPAGRAGAALDPDGRGRERLPCAIVHAVGSDCAIGKMTAVLELEPRRRGRGRADGVRADRTGRASRSPAGASRSTT